MLLTRLPEKTYRLAAHLVLAALAVVVLLTFRRYGISWDEEIQSQYGQAVYDYYASFFVDHRYDEIFNLYLYGGMFDGLAAFIDSYTPTTLYETRHLLNAIIGLVGLWGTWRLGRLMGGGFTGFMAMILLAATPVYYGHMFNNPKDIPFAAGIVWSLYFMTRALMAYPGIRLSILLKLGIVFGLTLGVRVNGFMTMGFWGLALAALALKQVWGRDKQEWILALGRVARAGIVAGATSYIVMLACWPWAQEAPLENPLRAIREFSNFPQVVEVLLAGKTYMSTELPWFYVPLYFFVQLPVLQLGLILAGLAGLPLVFRKALNTDGKRAALIVFLLSAGVPVSYAMLAHPALYDAVRHFTFILPPLCVLAALTFRLILGGVDRATAQIVPKTTRRALRGAAGGFFALLLILPLIRMEQLHPYEYMYINELEGGVRRAYGQFELDYWGSSFKEATEKLQKFVAAEGGVPAGRIYKVAVCGPWSPAMIYLPPDYETVEANEPADFFLATTRWMCQDMRAGKVIVRVERLGVPLSIIKDLRGTEEGRLGLPNYREEQAERAQKEKEKAAHEKKER